MLRLADFREIREGVSERTLSYRHDDELGWAPSCGDWTPNPLNAFQSC